MNNNLILRTLTSPYGDSTRGSVLSHEDVDNNFIFLKGSLIQTGSTGNNNLLLTKINGEIITIPLSITGNTVGSGSTVLLTGGSYSNGTAIFTNSTGGTFTVTGFTNPISGGGAAISAITFDNNNTLRIIDKTGQTLSTLINFFSGVTINGSLITTDSISGQGLSILSSGNTGYINELSGPLALNCISKKPVLIGTTNTIGLSGTSLEISGNCYINTSGSNAQAINIDGTGSIFMQIGSPLGLASAVFGRTAANETLVGGSGSALDIYLQSGTKVYTDFRMVIGGNLNNDANFQVYQPIVLSAFSSTAVTFQGTWSTSGSPVLLAGNVINISSSTTSKLVDFKVNNNSKLIVTVTGNTIIDSNIDNGQKLQVNGNSAIFGTSNVVQQLIKISSAQTISTPIFQIQNSNSTPIFAINTNGPNNIFIGVNNGINCNTPSGSFGLGNNNVGIGSFGCFQAITTAAANVSVGNRSSQALVNGVQNTAIGDAALFGTISGSGNVAIGQAALAFNVGNSENIGIGRNAGHGTGANFDRTILIGNSAYNTAIGGSDSVIIGVGAVSSRAVIHGDGNTVIGNGAASNSLLGSTNIIIGFHAHLNNDIGTNNISIGSNSSFTTVVSGSTLIGNLMTTSLNNIVGLGTDFQNIIIGSTNIITDNGAKHQINGNQSIAVIVSDASLTLTNSGGRYVYSGSGGDSWTLPLVSGHTGWYYFVKNRGSGILSIICSGTDNLFLNAPITNISMNIGDSYIISNDGTYWLIE